MPRVGASPFKKATSWKARADVTIIEYAFGQTAEEARYPIVEYASPR
jgi:hypothetical protein